MRLEQYASLRETFIAAKSYLKRLEKYEQNVDRCVDTDRTDGNETDESGRTESGDSGLLEPDGCGERDIPVQQDEEA